MERRIRRERTGELIGRALALLLLGAVLLWVGHRLG
ncbi:hypothetical protein GGQ59_000351 [Parvularcula dongshanensis]|uniref:Uncharacterized protein n=1 Tax=Parvularcula dongshanensis TaxID=1173995 RepID=A0A840I0P6_9PROT|nr:hypothetical protein [Parvularcula dongshanensis]